MTDTITINATDNSLIGNSVNLSSYYFTSNLTVYFDDFKIESYSNTTGIDNKENEIEMPKSFLLLQNYPNPFNPTTKINYSIKDAVMVTLKVYDILGNEVAILVNKQQMPGIYEVELNAEQVTYNKQLSSGVYFYRLQAGSFVEVKKLVLLK